MKIKGKTVVVYDIESFYNVFSCTTYNTETKETEVFEISQRKNNLATMLLHFADKTNIFCGYNNIHYDNIIINLLFQTSDKVLHSDYTKVCKGIFNYSKAIIADELPVGYKELKYAKYFDSFDLLTMLFSSKLRVGLKEMQVTMQYPNVQEFEGDFDAPLPVERIDEMLSYNLNDVMSTNELLNRCKADIELRLGIEQEYGVDVLSKDGMSIGTEILKIKYLQKTGKSWWEIKDLRTPCDEIDLSKVIFDVVHFNTPILQELLSELKQQKVSAGRKGYEKHFLLGDLEITVGVGGIHSKNNPEIIKPKSNELLLDSDVNSLYPSLIISYGLVPPHLGKEFLDIYAQVREERLYAKRNKQKVKNQTLKLALNGATGNYQNEHSWLYSPETVMKIRMNGQLLLLMLAEKLIALNARIIQVNTDGILYTIPKDAPYQEALKQWEEETKLTLETEEFEAFYQYAVNDYLAVGKGYNATKDKSLLKMKGLFIDKVSLGKGMQPMIIPKAINAYFADGIPIEQTIKNSRDINDFLTYQKVGKQFYVEMNGKKITNINRYYCVNNGYYLYKHRKGEDIKENGINILKSSGVKIANNLEEITEFPTDINYNYYIGEAKKIVFPMENYQMSLF